LRPKIGDLVWERQHPLSKATIGFAAKLAPKYGGSLKVTGCVSTVIAMFKHTTTGKTYSAYINELKPVVEIELT